MFYENPVRARTTCLNMKRLFYFNPDSEMAVANGSRYYTPPANIVRMAEELGYLPAYFSDRGDGVLLERYPDTCFLEERKKYFGLEPELVLRKNYGGAGQREAVPWGWSPRADYLLQAGKWKEEWKDLYSRLTALNCLKRWGEVTSSDISGILPQKAGSLEEIRKFTQGGGYIVKAPWSSSGKGLLNIGKEGVTEKTSEWLKGILSRQGYVTIEKRLHRVCDFAMEFYSDGKSCMNYLGLSLFYTGDGGEYRGNYVGGQAEIAKKLSVWSGEKALTSLRESMSRVLSECILPFYEGRIGVDMMIYKEEDGDYRIHPCVEINLRYTMGMLALSLGERYVSEHSEGIFTLSFHPEKGEALRKHRKDEYDFPLRMQTNKLVSGYINLTPVMEETKFMARLEIREKTVF